jgi:hypothetical protein
MCTLTLLSFFIAAAPTSVASDRELLFADLERRVGTEAWRSLEASEGGVEFLRELEFHEDWLHDLMDSGPVRRADKVLTYLHRLWSEDPGLRRREVDREMATACALAMGMKDYNADAMVDRYTYYRDSYAAGLLNACYEDLATWERRYLARGCQWGGEASGGMASVGSLEYLRDRISWPRKEYTGACWQAPYRSYSCLDDSVQGSGYYMPFGGAYQTFPEMVIDVGGVCGALSNLGASAAMANGIPATTMGEPGHCAYAVKINDTTWQPSYSLSWKRGMHTSFHEGSWPGLMITEACFSDPSRVEKAGALARKAHALEAERDLERADTHWRQATKAHGLHYELWLEWASFGERTSQDAAWWGDYHDALLRGLSDHEEPAWNILSKRVYPKLLEGMEDEDKRRLFISWVKGLETWGGGRWNIEGAWNWMLGHLDAKEQERFVRAVTKELIESSAFGPVCVAWLIGKYGPDSAEWESTLDGILRAAKPGGESSNAVLKQLARKALPDAALRGDIHTFQTIGEAASRLSEPRSMEGIEPFKGDLMSDGGLLLVSGRGNRWDSPEHHWGILGEHGGVCHTDNGASHIAVRLEHHTELTGVIIQNVVGGQAWRASGCRVEISSDGEHWEEVGALEGTNRVYRIDLSGREHRCAWVRIAKDTNCLHVNRFLVYGHRRS